jgi:hypothetical protein
MAEVIVGTVDVEGPPVPDADAEFRAREDARVSKLEGDILARGKSFTWEIDSPPSNTSTKPGFTESAAPNSTSPASDLFTAKKKPDVNISTASTQNKTTAQDWRVRITVAKNSGVIPDLEYSYAKVAEMKTVPKDTGKVRKVKKTEWLYEEPAKGTFVLDGEGNPVRDGNGEIVRSSHDAAGNPVDPNATRKKVDYRIIEVEEPIIDNENQEPTGRYTVKQTLKQESLTHLNVLKEYNGVVFPYTPQISYSHKATYQSTALTHANYSSTSFENSDVSEISISGDFVVQNDEDARYLMGAIYFFRAVTKMYYGGQSGANTGNPPPMVFLDGMGKAYFPHVPCVVTSFAHEMSPDVDYVELSNNFYGSSVFLPTISKISVVLKPTYSKQNVYNNFNFNDFARGKLIDKGGFI